MPELGPMQDRSFAALMAREKQYEKQLATALRSSLDEMRLQMSRIYEKYAVDGILTTADMTRYNRLATAEKQLVDSLNPAIRANLQTIARLRPEQYQAAFFRYAWTIDNASGIRLAWGVLNRDVILENLANSFYRLSVEDYGPRARVLVRKALNQGLTIGKGYPAMIRDIKSALNTTNALALRILRTEGQTAVNAGTDDAYARALAKGVEGKQIWDATLDAETRPSHQAMDQQARGDDGLFDGPGGNRAPYPAWDGLPAEERIHCRCHMRFEIEGYAPQLRRSREQGLVPAQSYAQWENDHTRLRF